MLASDHDDLRGVNILDPKQLLQFAQDTSPQGRTRLAKAVSNIFEESALTEAEQKIASEILMNLIRQAEVDLRVALSERLAVLDTVPHELVVYLANDAISVARPVLMHSPLLTDIDLMYIISAKGEDYWQSIAHRDGVSPMVADKLIDMGDPSTIMNLIDNQRVNLQKSTMKKIARASLTSESLQAPLLRRPEVDGDIAVDLYMVVSEALRNDIAQKFPIAQHVLEHSMESLVHELSAAAHGSRDATPAMLALAEKFKARGEISTDQMIRTLRRGQIGFFVALFAAKTGLQPDQIVTMIQTDQGKAFVVACRSIGMLKSEFASVFLLSRGIRTGDKIVDQRELAMAIKHFDGLKDFDVERILATWLRAHANA